MGQLLLIAHVKHFSHRVCRHKNAMTYIDEEPYLERYYLFLKERENFEVLHISHNQFFYLEDHICNCKTENLPKSITTFDIS